MYLPKDTLFFSEFPLRPASVPSREVSDSLCSLQNTPQTHLRHGTPHALDIISVVAWGPLSVGEDRFIRASRIAVHTTIVVR